MRNLLRILSVFVISSFLLSGCDGTDYLGNEEEFCESEAGKRYDLLFFVNEARANSQSCGGTDYPPAPTLSWNHQLADAALRHSRDMAKHHFLDHIGSDKTSPDVRISDAGYEYMMWGENIARGNPSPEEMVMAWLESPGHCANMMNTEFVEMGAASASENCDDIYWTLVLAKPVKNH